MALSWSAASYDEDHPDFAAFSCWDGSAATPWIQEVEDYVRNWVLRHAAHVLAFRDEEGDLVAVAAFDESAVSIPILEPISSPSWHLLVVAVRMIDQRQGLSTTVFEGVFEAMRQVDNSRVLYTAHVHRENHASIGSSARVGLLPLVPRDEHYWILLGEVPDA